MIGWFWLRGGLAGLSRGSIRVIGWLGPAPGALLFLGRGGGGGANVRARLGLLREHGPVEADEGGAEARAEQGVACRHAEEDGAQRRLPEGDE